MPRSKDFNEEAMERKIKNNNARGIDNPKIVALLREELISVTEKLLQMEKIIALHEQRAMELSDQIDYMKEKYGIDNKISTDSNQ